MLAKPFNKKWFKSGGYLQPKLDGVRMVWTGSEVMSRRGKPIKGVPTLVEELEKFFRGIPLDGELYAHGKDFQKLVGSIRRSKNVDEDFDIGYHVYDMPVEDLGFEERYAALSEIMRERPGISRIHLVETILAPDDDEDMNLFESEGYEGTMWRSSDGPYKFGKRSSDLMKLKNFLEEEFEIIGVNELMLHQKLIVEAETPGANQYSDGRWYKNGEARNGKTCGSIVIITPDGVEVDVGTGLDDVTRLAYWTNPPIGKRLTVKFQGYTEDGSLRFPVHKTVRDYE
jgi:DNA ligase-1